MDFLGGWDFRGGTPWQVHINEEIEVLQMKLKFIYNDLIMFYKIVNKIFPVDVPTKVKESYAE